MKLDSFRELLLRKVSDPYLKTLIKYSKDEILFEHVTESLEKMAVSQHKARNANQTVRSFATEMDPEHEPTMIHDALSHHISGYKAAISKKNQDVANKHAKQAFKLMNLAATVSPHSEGKLHLEYVDPKPWERHHKLSQDENGRFKTDTKGLNWEGPDFQHLQRAPHESYSKDQTVRTHNKAYPWEHTAINGKHVAVEEGAGDKYVPHEFDTHPIMYHFKDAAKNRSAADHERYQKELEDWNENHLPKWFERHEGMQSQNPEAYASRGSSRAEPVHPDVEPLQVASAPAVEEKAAPAEKQKTITRKKDSGKVDMSDPKAKYQALIYAGFPEEEAKKYVSAQHPEHKWEE